MTEGKRSTFHTRPEGEGPYDGWGDCPCGKSNQPLHRMQCPRCAFSRAYLSYYDVHAEGMNISTKGFLPVSGWELVKSGDRMCVLVGYIHEARTREGWEVCLEDAKRDNITNLILGFPQDILVPTNMELEEEQE